MCEATLSLASSTKSSVQKLETHLYKSIIKSYYFKCNAPISLKKSVTLVVSFQKRQMTHTWPTNVKKKRTSRRKW